MYDILGFGKSAVQQTKRLDTNRSSAAVVGRKLHVVQLGDSTGDIRKPLGRGVRATGIQRVSAGGDGRRGHVGHLGRLQGGQGGTDPGVQARHGDGQRSAEAE